MKFLLVGCATVLFVGIVAGGILGYLGYRAYRRHVAPVVNRIEKTVKTFDRELNLKVSTDSNQVNRIAGQIMRFRIPGGSKGDSAVSAGQFKLAVLEGKSKTSPVTLVLVSLPPESRTSEWKEMHKFVLDTLAPIAGTEGFTQEKASEEQRMLCGKPVRVDVEEGWVGGGTDQKIPAMVFKTRVSERGGQIMAVIEASGASRKKMARDVLDSLACP